MKIYGIVLSWGCISEMVQKVTKLKVYLNWTYNIVNLTDGGRVAVHYNFVAQKKKKEEIYETATHKFLCRNFLCEIFHDAIYLPEFFTEPRCSHR